MAVALSTSRNSEDNLSFTLPPISQLSTASLEKTENKIRSHVYSMRIRIADSFRDFDKLRSGFLQRSQFQRCLRQSIEKGVNLDEKEYNLIMDCYDTKGNGMVQYTGFIESIEKVFGVKNLEKTPTISVALPHDILKTTRPLSPASEIRVNETIHKVRQYVAHHGFDVKSWYRDFDKHNNGIITVNQYRRGFPPNLLSPEDMELLLRLYCDDATQTVNYFKFNVHVNRKNRPPNSETRKILVAKQRQDHPHVPIGTEIVLEQSSEGNTKFVAIDVEGKIKREVYTHRIRLIDFFANYDRHHHGLITEPQFRAGLTLSRLNVSAKEIDILAAAYRVHDGRIAYKSFCQTIDSIFTRQDIEQNPTLEIQPELTSTLMKKTNALSPVKEELCEQIISQFRTHVQKRRLNMVPFFKDFDKKAGRVGQITKSQFARLLTMLNLHISDADLYILLDKYEDKRSGHINYKEFISQIDSDSCNALNSQIKIVDQLNKTDEFHSLKLEYIMDNLIYTVASKRIRINEFFRDFDRLRSGTVLRGDFIRALNQMSLILTKEESDAIAEAYTDPLRKDQCRWRDLEKDVNLAIGQYADLELTPTLTPKTKPLMNRSTNRVTQTLTDSEKSLLSMALTTIRKFLKFRQNNPKSSFMGFDKLSSGRVSTQQFRQVLTYLGVRLNEDEVRVLCKNWTDESSKNEFYYIPFLNELEKIETKDEVDELEFTKAHLVSTPKKSTTQSKVLTQQEIDNLILKMKTKVKTERIRIQDFMRDFDHLLCGRISRNEFRRALAIYNFNLTEAEFAALENLYSSKTHQNLVNYKDFCDQMELVFTRKGLESDPTCEPLEFKPHWHEHGEEASRLTNLQSQQLKIMMHRLGEFLRQRRMDILRYLEDHDRPRNGMITKSQFLSALSAVGINMQESNAELIFKRYTLNGDEYIDYLSFNDDLLDMGKNVWKENECEDTKEWLRF